MKKLIITTTLATVLALPAIAVRPRPNTGGLTDLELGLEKSKDTLSKELDQAEKELREAQRQIERQLAQADTKKQIEDQVSQAQAATEAAEAATEAAAEASTSALSDIPALTTRLQSIVHRSHGNGRALVIRSSESDAKSQSGIEEDLAVMSHILEKSLDENVGKEPRRPKAMGIELVFGSGSSPFQNMYLDGYGALFMLHVNFPLLPNAKTEVRKEKTETSSTWEEARQELYGSHNEMKVLSTSSEEYDEEKVTKLKDGLLEALKNAANIRDLKPDDAITVCVFGGITGSVRPHSVTTKRGSSNTTVLSDPQVWIVNDGRSRRTSSIMTIRVKKLDADAFAKGKFDLEEFRKKAKITTYVGSADTGGMNSSYGFGSGYGYGSGFGYDYSR